MRFRTFSILFVLASCGMLAAILALNAIVDPFDYHDWNILQFNRYAASFTVNPWLFRVSTLQHTHAPGALFGDSEINAMDPLAIAGPHTDKLFDFAVPGQTLPDTLDSVDYAVQRHAFRQVFVGISYYRMHESAHSGEFLQNAKIADHFYTMDLSQPSIRASAYAFYEWVTGRYPSLGHGMDSRKMPLLQNRLMTRMELLSLNRDIMEKVRLQLCALHRKGYDAIALNPPMYSSLRKAIESKFPERWAFYEKWKESLPAVLDYNFDNAFNANQANFQDLLHLSPTGRAIIVDDIASGGYRIGKLERHPNACASG